MNNFKYKARDAKGLCREGLYQAENEQRVLVWLREESLTPVSIIKIINKVNLSGQGTQRKRIKSADMAAICWQLATMVEGGVPIIQALETLSEDIDNIQLQEALEKIVEKMEQGESLSDSIADFPKLFNAVASATILAGESSGTMPNALNRLAVYFDNRDKLLKKIKSAMAYPVFVASFVVLIVVVVMTFIIPRFTAIFDQLGGNLPLFTRGFMAVYDGLRENIIIILGGIILLTVLMVAVGKTRKGFRLFCGIALAMPLFGKILRQSFVITFCKTMATLLASGVSILEVFDILGGMTKNVITRSAIMRGKTNVVGGSNISLSLADTGFFPNMLIKMIQVGEESGSLPKVLDKTAEYYERKVDTTISTATSLLEPIMIVTVGAIVLVVVIALYLPIFSMGRQS